MSSMTFDTLKFANILKEAGVPDKQAEAEARALSDVLDINFKELVTKGDLRADISDLRHDLAQAESRLEVKIAESKAEMVRWVVAVGLLQITIITALLLRLLPS